MNPASSGFGSFLAGRQRTTGPSIRRRIDQRKEHTMSISRKRVASAALALTVVGGIAVAGTGVASATDRPGALSCAADQTLVGPHDYFAFIQMVDGQSVPDCFQNAGTLQFDPPEAASRFTSGNNAGSIDVQCPGDVWVRQWTFDKQQDAWLCGGVPGKVALLKIN
jgi:hypothetical protein